jgi:hypothetical protein
MKNLFIAIIVIFSFTVCSTNSSAQIRKIPADVTDAFTAKFPNAKSVEWRDKLTGFSASFNEGDTAYVASFDNGGNWQSTEHGIEQEALPGAVQDGFEKSRFADWNVNNITYIDTPDGVNYRIEVGKGDIKKRNLYFNAKGRLMKDKLTL